MMGPRIFASIVLALALGASGLAMGQPTAADHDAQARAYFRTASYARAADEFRKAYAIDKNPARLFNIGLAYEKAGDKIKASAAYGEYLQEAPEGDQAIEARARQDALAREVAEEERRRLDAAAKEGRDLAAKALADEAAQRLKAGRHQDAAEGYQAAYDKNGEAKYIFDRAEALRLGGASSAAIAAYREYRRLAPEGLYEGEARRRQNELEEAAAAANRAALPANPELGRSANVSMSKSAPTPPSGRGLRLTGYVSGGISLVALGVGLYGRSRYEHFNNLIIDGTDKDATDDPVAYDIASQIGLSVSLQTLSAGGLCYFMGAGDRRDTKASTLGSCILGGWGVGAILMGGLLEIRGQSYLDEVNGMDFDQTGQWTYEAERLTNRAEAFDEVAQAHLVFGAGSLALGGLFYWLGSDDAVETQRLSITPTVTGRHTGLSGTWQF